MTKQNKSIFTGSRVLGKNKAIVHTNNNSESLSTSHSESNHSDTNSENTTSIMKSILSDSQTNNMFLKQQPHQQMISSQAMGQQMISSQAMAPQLMAPQMMAPQMMAPQMMAPQMMGQQMMPNLSDVDSLMVNTLAPINNMSQMSMGNNLLSGSQMAHGMGSLANLGKLSTGLNIDNSIMMSEIAPNAMQPQMMTPHAMQQMNGLNVQGLKHIANLNSINMI